MTQKKAHTASIKSSDSKITYKPSLIEPKWQAKWEEEGVYQPDLENAKRPFYNLMMFPYPSAEGLHIGSIFTFGGVDVYARFKRMQGYDVFEPIGLDGFGIHSENHALKTGTHPIEHAKRTEDNFYRQLHTTGISYAWKNKLETYDPGYYKWTQWLFIELFKAGLAYKKKSPVNFCPSCKTVLADEQVIDGHCERCNSIVEKRDLEQWFFKITDYADRLLNNIEGLNWSHKVKIAQHNWIGKKTGINITYHVIASEAKQSHNNQGIASSPKAPRNDKFSLTVFTTRPDTNYGATFIALAPEHPLALSITTKENEKAVKTYIDKALKKSEIERAAEGKDKTGVFTGSYCINPLTGYKMPVWISDFVLAGFGTGALVGVPGHDKRDFEFAHKFKLDIKRVVVGKDGDTSPITSLTQVQEETGTMVNSDFLNGMDIHKATEKIMDYMEEKGWGKRVSTYHLRDWLISRQRYWGPPIPMVYCQHCASKGLSWFSNQKSKKKVDLAEMAGWYPVADKDLPVKLPYIEDYKPMGTGKAPLANYPDFYETTCPGCGAKATRETDVSDTFLDSAWYFFRYISTDRDDVAFDRALTKKWLPVTMYIGGAEHSVLHLLYARFVTMVLKDLGYIDFEEPFARFYAHGLIIKDGAKMSKSKGNVINPDDYIHKYGADAVRAYLLFLGPFNQGGDFRDTGMEGMYRFLKRVWFMFAGQTFSSTSLSDSAKNMLHETIKGVTEDLEELRYNTGLAKLMTYYNFLAKQPQISREEAEAYIKLFAPFAPHMTEELWQQLRVSKVPQVPHVGDEAARDTRVTFHSVHTSAWPTYDEDKIVHEEINLAVQVNGKLRGVLKLTQDSPKDEKAIQELAKNEPGVAKFLEGKTIKKAIYVVGKIINFVVV